MHISGTAPMGRVALFSQTFVFLMTIDNVDGHIVNVQSVCEQNTLLKDFWVIKLPLTAL